MKPVCFLFFLPALSALASIGVIYRKATPALNARKWLVTSMLCGGLCALLLAHYYIPGMRLSLSLCLLTNCALLSLAPCYYLCIKSLTSFEGIRLRDYLAFAPGAMLMVVNGLLMVFMGGEESQTALEEIVLRTRPVAEGHSWAFRAYAFFGHTFFRSFVILSLMSVFYRGAWAIRDYRQQLEDYIVDISPSMTRGIQLLYVSFVLFATVSMVFAACEYAQTFTAWVIPTLSAGTAISFALMGYFAWQVEYSAEMITRTRTQTRTENGDEDGNPFRERLAVIEQEKLFRDPNLTIFSLSRTIGTNRTYLTKAFRDCYGESFSQHINRLRIEEAVRVMHEHPKMPLHDVAQQVGYNSATSLYRNFVRMKHCAPSEYEKKMARCL